jgi:hypothetical protein
MRPLILLFLSLSVLASAPSASAQWPLPNGISWQFAASLGSTTTSQLFSLFLVKVDSSCTVLESQPLTRENFIRQVQGRTFSKANPDAEDLFRKYDVKQCTLPEDSAHMGFLTNCSTLDDLWRLRYWEYPQQVEEGQRERLGWASEKLRPGERQMLLLAKYGMKYPLDLIIGEHLFLLLKDMGDPEWVANYRGGL